MSILLHEGPVWADTEKRFEEAYEFLRREVSYAVLLCGGASGPSGEEDEVETTTDPERERFAMSGLAAAESAMAYLELALKCEAKRRDAANLKECQRLREETEDCLRILPGLLRAFTTHYLQRREKAVHQFFSRSTTHPHFSLSEVDLEYSITIRAIEVLAEWNHLSLRPFCGNVDLSAPLVSIAGEHFPALQYRGVERRKLSEDLAEQMRLAQNACWYLLPRWIPAQMRFASVLGHEAFHRILALADALHNEKAMMKPKRDSNPEDPRIDDRERKIRTTVSDELVELEGARVQLRETLFLLQQELLKAKDSERDRWTMLKRAKAQADELLCDVAGLVLSGPAFLYVSPSWLLASHEREELSAKAVEAGGITYPPSYARVRLQRMVLGELMGFHETADEFDDMFGFGRTWDHVAESQAYTKHYGNVITTGQCREAFRTCVRLVSSSMRASGRVPHIAGAAGSLDEQTWRGRWDELIAKAARAEVLSDDLAGFNPPDVLNAIWRKMQHRDYVNVPEYRMQWRMALRNLGRPPRGVQ